MSRSRRRATSQPRSGSRRGTRRGTAARTDPDATTGDWFVFYEWPDSYRSFPLARALRLTFVTEEWSLARIDGFLDLYEACLADGRDRSSLKLVSLCMLILRPTPVLCCGTEIGETQTVSSSDRASGGDALVRRDIE